MKKKPFKCDVCGHNSSQKVNMKTHLETVHAKKKTFICDICDFICYRKDSMERHVALAHEKKNHLNVRFVIIAVLLKIT